MLDVAIEREQQYHEDEYHREPLQRVEVAAHLQQRVGGIIIGVKHQQVRITTDSVADTDIVAIAAAYRIILAANGCKYQIITTV